MAALNKVARRQTHMHQRQGMSREAHVDRMKANSCSYLRSEAMKARHSMLS